MSIHDAPRPGEVVVHTSIMPSAMRVDGRDVDPRDTRALRRRGVRLHVRPIADLEERDAREQQAIADAVEGVIP